VVTHTQERTATCVVRAHASHSTCTPVTAAATAMGDFLTFMCLLLQVSAFTFINPAPPPRQKKSFSYVLRLFEHKK